MDSSRIRIKFCGMTRREDLLHAAMLGVDAVGLIFYPKSARAVSIDSAKEITRHLPAFLSVVGVFVNPSVDFVQEKIANLPLHYLQFHGEETPVFCEQFNRPYIKAMPAESTETIIEIAKQHTQAAAILLDTPSPRHGGTGTPFDWRIIPDKFYKPIILAGGLDAGNVSEALKTRAVYGVDTCSGIEQSPGIKDYTKMSQFIEVLEKHYE